MRLETPAARSRLWAACLAVAVLFGAGCGDRTKAPLSGTVTLDGEPLKAGFVYVHGEDGRVTSTGIEADGKYRIPDAPVGKVTLAVITLPAGQEVLPPDAKGTPTKLPARPPFVEIPKHYHEAKTSGLTTTVEPGQENRFDLGLKK
jgi:hypothetical protein